MFERYRHVLDAELQQRACEFYALASRSDDDELLQNVCEEMPPFPPRQSTLLSRVNRKAGDTEDKRTWLHGGKEANTATKETLPNGASGPAAAAPDDVASVLAGLDMSSAGADAAQPAPLPSPPALATPSATADLATGPNVERWYEKLTYHADGVLYEDVQIQIGVKSRYHTQLGQLAIYMGNKLSAPMTSLTATVASGEPDALAVSFAKMPPTTIAPRTQAQLLLQVECKKPFAVPPTMTVSFLAGSHQSIALRVPVVVTKFFEHVSLGQADFFERWRLIGGPPREAQSVFPIRLTDAGNLDLARQQKVVSGHRFNIMGGIDPNPNNIVGAAVLHTSVAGKVGCLLRVEPNKDAKVRSSVYGVVPFYSCHHAALPCHRAQHVRGSCERGAKVAPAATAGRFPIMMQ